MSDESLFLEDCARIRSKAPLVHNITNFVAMNMSANALLAIGASPIMSFCPDEMTDIVSGSSSLAVNLGCLDSQLVKAARIAAATALQAGKPWVLDPVGTGASGLRNRISTDLALNYHPTVIRANAGEIMALATLMGFDGSTVKADAAIRGVDSAVDTAQARESAAFLARVTGAIVSMSGATDIVTDGENSTAIEGGSPLMPRVTAMGCTATAITAAFLAVQGDPFTAAIEAMELMARAGSAAAHDCPGTGTFTIRFIDELSKI